MWTACLRPLVQAHIKDVVRWCALGQCKDWLQWSCIFYIFFCSLDRVWNRPLPVSSCIFFHYARCFGVSELARFKSDVCSPGLMQLGSGTFPPTRLLDFPAGLFVFFRSPCQRKLCVSLAGATASGWAAWRPGSAAFARRSWYVCTTSTAPCPTSFTALWRSWWSQWPWHSPKRRAAEWRRRSPTPRSCTFARTPGMATTTAASRRWILPSFETKPVQFFCAAAVRRNSLGSVFLSCIFLLCVKMYFRRNRAAHSIIRRPKFLFTASRIWACRKQRNYLHDHHFVVHRPFINHTRTLRRFLTKWSPSCPKCKTAFTLEPNCIQFLVLLLTEILCLAEFHVFTLRTGPENVTLQSTQFFQHLNGIPMIFSLGSSYSQITSHIKQLKLVYAHN